MKIFSYTFIITILLLLTNSCKNSKKIKDRPDEFIHLNQVKIDSRRFTVLIYSKTALDSTILYTSTITGPLKTVDDLQTEWFDDSVVCIVPTYVPEKTFKTPTDLKVTLIHRP